MGAERANNDNSPAPPVLHLHLFGGFRATRDGGPALAERWPRPSARALVKLLAVTPGHSLHREQAMDICWPDADAQAATGSLRVALHAARRALEPELAPRAASSYLISDGALLRLDPRTVWIDADHAEQQAEKALDSGRSPRLAEALGLFTGELLPEDRYAPWTESRRERLAVVGERLRIALAEALLDEGDADEAATVARSALDENPADERAHQLLMSSYLRQGLRRQAVRQFHACREALDAELGVRPGPETQRLHLLALDAGSAASPVARPVGGYAPPAALRGPAPAPLRGRDRALERLLSPDAPPVQLIGGEVGLGKTRLVSEAARRAAADGAAVLWGAGHDAEGHTPYGAFVEALDGWLAERPPAERARAGAEFPELASLLPSLGQAGAGAERSPEEERERLFGAAAGLIGELAATAPVLVVLDDLHAADSGSFQLLSHLARRTGTAPHPVRFAVTYRSEELPEFDPRRTSLEALARGRLAEYLDLGRLSRADCLALAADALGLADGTNAPERVWDLSLGNPLFALELARALNDGGLQAPDGVRQLVAARLARLGPAARRVVEAVAVAGGDAALAEVLDVASAGLHPLLSVAEATAGADAAVAASVLAERDVVADGRGVPGLTFRHPLVRLTCYERLSTARRRLLHSAYAEAVLRRRPDAVDTLAAHLTRADDPRATGYLRQAAERAAALCANDTADHYYAQLTERLDAFAAESARARIDRAAVLRRMARYHDAAQVLREALDDLERRGDADGRVLAAARLTEVLAKTRSTEEGFALLDAAPPGEDTAPEAATAHHLARSMLCFVTGRYPEAVTAGEAAHAAAQQVTGPEHRGLLARSLAAQATSLALAGRFAQARPVADRALPHAEAYGDPQLLGSVLSVLREHSRRSGQLREAIVTGERALALAERSGDPTAAAFERANLAELHLLLEESDAAQHLAQDAVNATEPHTGWCAPYALAALARVRMRSGGAESCAALLDRAGLTADAQGDRQAQQEVRLARAELAVRRGRAEEALALLAGATDAGHLTAWAHLEAGRAAQAATLAEAEATRAQEAGERLAEAEARAIYGRARAALEHP
ncbi:MULTISPECIES: AAA family ATPase [unclassified Streptomyces]|uniref:AAA family ATPase n=1 Tax=Streptomyces sp. NBC_00119 TaxID=2975659 RepID=A0AAU1UHQ8_9ACTN|nr:MULTISPECIES: AAA family ATPase [unclassified Streptomyces]MCX4646440.1 AAA family ATPase [Streptomyces sp. NBC_01446]MCX5319064.1 AAA family ATPase [Streptomyces sp. NBC_00120]